MNILHLFSVLGLPGLSLVIFLENGILPAFFLPGDSLLFSAGYFIKTGKIAVPHAILALGLAAFLGNMLGYALGAFAEGPISRYAHHHHKGFARNLKRTRDFYTKYGMLTVFFGRFIPIVRTITPFLAGVSRLNLVYFSITSLLSGFIWVGVGLALGRFFGKILPNLGILVSVSFMMAIFFSVAPFIWPLLKKRKKTEII